MRDLNDILDLTLRLPIGGKVSQVQPPPAAVGAHLMNRLALGIAVDAGIPVSDDERGAVEVTDDELPDFARMCLGDAYDEMVADGLDSTRIEFAVTTAFYAWTVGKAFAEAHWEAGGKLAGATATATPPTAIPTPTAAGSSSQTSASVSGTRRPQDRKPKGSR